MITNDYTQTYERHDLHKSTCMCIYTNIYKHMYIYMLLYTLNTNLPLLLLTAEKNGVLCSVKFTEHSQPKGCHAPL